LLGCFRVKRLGADPKPVSVYQINNDLDDVEAAAATALITGGSIEKRFGLVVTEEDCRAAGITIDAKEPGTTGVYAVDGRHRDLTGKTEEFAKLMVLIVKAMWEGEQRVRLYPAHQLIGQIAVLSKPLNANIDPSTRQDCVDALGK